MGDLTLPSAWKSGTSLVLIRAEVLGPFAVHESRSIKGWTLTQSSCGYAVVQGWPSMDSCKYLAQELLRGGLWSSWGDPLHPDPELPLGPDLAAVRAVIQRAALEFGVDIAPTVSDIRCGAV